VSTKSGEVQTSADNIFFAWQEGIAKAGTNPIHKQQLLQKEAELLPRFAAHYKQLKALPRRMRRTLQRKWKQGLAGVALLMMLGQVPAHAATITVNAKCTLPRAVTAANTDTTASGNCAKGGGADTIVLPSGSTQKLTDVNNTTPYGPTGLPVIRSVITIVGNGSTIRRGGGAPQFRIFAVAGIGNLELQRTTVSGGVAHHF